MCWIGIDVSKAHLDVCILAATGEVKHLRVENNKTGFEQIIATLKDRYSRVVLEATGVYHLRLQQDLQAQNVLVSVINPRQILGFAKSQNRRNKTDKVDAALLAQFAKEREPTPSPKLNEQAKDIVRELQALNDDMTRLKNRLGAAEAGLAPQGVKASLKRRIRSLKEEKQRSNNSSKTP